MIKKIAFLGLFFGCFSVFANPITAAQIPSALQDWQAWVLYDKPEQACPFLYNQNDTRVCAWPTELSVDIQLGRIYFNQTWQVFAQSAVSLPGEMNAWPQNVQVNGSAYPVIDHDGTPMIELLPGAYQVQGFILYDGQLPESLQIPAHTAIVQLAHAGQAVHQPRLDDAGRLWLHDKANNPVNAALQMRVFRKITQAVPMEVLTFIELDVSGPAREVQLGPVLLPETVATRIDSSLPAQLDESGLLRVQLRPGQWQVAINSRFLQNVETLKRAEVGPPWPAEEIWSFNLDPRLDVMSVSGVPNVDPSQTAMPEDWRALPAYRVLIADPVLLINQGKNQQTRNQLTLNREMWLDFSGQLWTVADQLQGSMTSHWRMSLLPPFMLGNFSVDDKAQLITLLEDNQGRAIAGVEVRQGQLSASAMSLIKNLWRLPAVGWDETFNSVNTTLHLPPGWQLFTALGADQHSGSWLAQWSLLDIFIILLIALALTTVLGTAWGVAGLFMLLLTYHQSGAPIWLWLNLVLVLWLLHWLKQSRGRIILVIYRDISFAVLAMLIVWLASSSLIASLYPQLNLSSPHMLALEKMQHLVPTMMKQQGSAMSGSAVAEGVMFDRKMQAQPLSQPDPFIVPIDAKTQTGPAKPEWQGSQAELSWTRPNENQHVYLVLISPLIQRILTVLQIVLLVSVGLSLWRTRKQVLQMHIPFRRSSLLAILCALIILPNAQVHAEIPDPAILDALQTRLLAPDPCLPQCASISQAAFSINAEEIHIILQVDALSTVAVPIPGRSAYWQVQEVLVDNLPARALTWQDNTLMVQLDKGMHTIAMKGSVQDIDKLSFEFSLMPHWLDVQVQGWFVEGLAQHQLSGNTLHLSRAENADAQNGMVATITPFARVIRNLSLGITGEVTTQVVRVAPVMGSMQLQIPLLPHETVISDNIQVQNNRALIYFAPDTREITWKSTIANFSDLTLLAPQTHEWVEEWRVEVSPIWHPSITGTAALQGSPDGYWQSVFQPWPLDSVHIQLIRPQAMPGQTMTIEQVNLLTDVQTHNRNMSLQALLRSTLGEQRKLILPENAVIDSVQVNGIAQMLQTGREVILSLSPGNNWVDITWHTQEALGSFTRTPVLDWGVPAYNIQLGLNMPADRFVIALGAEGYGPALLYWIWIVGAVVIAVLLSKMTTIPLRLWQWLLLTVGLSIVTPFLGLWVVVAIVLLSMREKLTTTHRSIYLGIQGVLCAFMLVALLILLHAVFRGLHDAPDLQLVPSALGSSFIAQYVWLQDLAMQVWPRAFVVSLPLWVYRGLMLLWSLWLVLLLFQLIPWAWQVMMRYNKFSKP